MTTEPQCDPSEHSSVVRVVHGCSCAIGACGLAAGSSRPLRLAGAPPAPCRVPLVALLLGFVAGRAGRRSHARVAERGARRSPSRVRRMSSASLLAAPSDLVVARVLAAADRAGGGAAAVAAQAAVQPGDVRGRGARRVAGLPVLLIGDRRRWRRRAGSRLRCHADRATSCRPWRSTVAITSFSGLAGRTVVQQVLRLRGVVVRGQHRDRRRSSPCRSGTESHRRCARSSASSRVLFVLYRAYTGLTERHKNLETLHDFTRSLGGSRARGARASRRRSERGRSCGASTARCCSRRCGAGCRRRGLLVGDDESSGRDISAGRAGRRPCDRCCRTTRRGSSSQGSRCRGGWARSA